MLSRKSKKKKSSAEIAGMKKDHGRKYKNISVRSMDTVTNTITERVKKDPQNTNNSSRIMAAEIGKKTRGGLISKEGLF